MKSVGIQWYALFTDPTVYNPAFSTPTTPHWLPNENGTDLVSIGIVFDHLLHCK